MTVPVAEMNGDHRGLDKEACPSTAAVVVEAADRVPAQAGAERPSMMEPIPSMVAKYRITKTDRAASVAKAVTAKI